MQYLDASWSWLPSRCSILHLALCIYVCVCVCVVCVCVFFKQKTAYEIEYGLGGLGDVYKRQVRRWWPACCAVGAAAIIWWSTTRAAVTTCCATNACLLYTSDAADERSSVDLGGRRIITKQKL